MDYDVREGVFEVSGNVGIGVGSCSPRAQVFIGEGAASWAAGDTVGFGNKSPVCRLEVRGEGKAGKVLKKK